MSNPRSSPHAQERRKGDGVDVSIEGRGLVQNIPLTALRIESPTFHNVEISSKDIIYGRKVLVDLKNGQWAPGIVCSAKRLADHNADEFTDDRPETHILSHFPNTPYTPLRSDALVVFDLTPAVARTPEASARLTQMMEEFHKEVKRVAKEKTRLDEAYRLRMEEEDRLNHDREELRRAVAQTRVLRAAEERALMKERMRLEAAIRLTDEEREMDALQLAEERQFLSNVLTSIESHAANQLTEEETQHFVELKHKLKSRSPKQFHEDKEELAMIASRLFNEQSFERYSDIPSEHRHIEHLEIDNPNNEADDVGNEELEEEEEYRQQDELIEGPNSLAVSSKTLHDFEKLQNALIRELEDQQEEDTNINVHQDKEEEFNVGDFVWCWFEEEWYEAVVVDIVLYIEENDDEYEVYVVDLKDFEVDGLEVLEDHLRPFTEEDQDEAYDVGGSSDDEGLEKETSKEEEEHYRSMSIASLRRSERTLEEFEVLNLTGDSSEDNDSERAASEEGQQQIQQEEGGESIQGNQLIVEGVGDDEDEGNTHHAVLESGRMPLLGDSNIRHSTDQGSGTDIEGENRSQDSNEVDDEAHDDADEGSDVSSSVQPFEEGDLVWARMNASQDNWFAGVVSSWSVLETGEEIFTVRFPGFKDDSGSPSKYGDECYEEGGLLMTDLKPRSQDDALPDSLLLRSPLLDHNLSVIFSEGSEEGSQLNDERRSSHRPLEVVPQIDENEVLETKQSDDSESAHNETIEEETHQNQCNQRREDSKLLVEEATRAIFPLLQKELTEHRHWCNEEQDRLRREEELLVDARLQLEQATKSSIALQATTEQQIQALSTQRQILTREQQRLNSLRAQAETERRSLIQQREANEERAKLEARSQHSLYRQKQIEQEFQFQQEQLELSAQMQLHRLRQERASLSSQRSLNPSTYAAMAAAEVEAAATADRLYERGRVPAHNSPGSPLTDEDSPHGVYYYNSDPMSTQPFTRAPLPPPAGHVPHSSYPVYPYHNYFSQREARHQQSQDSLNPSESGVFGTSPQHAHPQEPPQTSSASTQSSMKNPDPSTSQARRTLSPPIVVAGGWQPIEKSNGSSSLQHKKTEVEARRESGDSVSTLEGKELSFSQGVYTPQVDHFGGPANTHQAASIPWWEGGGKTRAVPSRKEVVQDRKKKKKVSQRGDSAQETRNYPNLGDKPAAENTSITVGLTPQSTGRNGRDFGSAGSSIRDPASVRARAKAFDNKQRQSFLQVGHEEEAVQHSPTIRPKVDSGKSIASISRGDASSTEKKNMVKKRWEAPPKPIMSWKKKTNSSPEKPSQKESVNRLYGQHFKTKAKLEEARLRAEMDKNPGLKLPPKLEGGHWHDGRWRQQVEEEKKNAEHAPIESCVELTDELTLTEVESILRVHKNRPLPLSVGDRLIASLSPGGSLSSPTNRNHASVHALREKVTHDMGNNSPSSLDPASVMGRVSPTIGVRKSWLSESSSEHRRRKSASPAPSLRSSVRSISSGRLRASTELTDELQELLDQSNAINYLQVQRGASRKTWSHGPRRRRPRPPRPAIRRTGSLSSTSPPTPRILKTRFIRQRVKPKSKTPADTSAKKKDFQQGIEKEPLETSP